MLELLTGGCYVLGPAVYPGVLPTSPGVADQCKAQVVALPYSIPGEIADRDLEEMERSSLQCLAARFALEHIGSDNSSKPQALLLELILASNGAELTIRFLRQLFALCKRLDVNVVIDED